ncbi:MAG: YggS family pyridoxal phosphate-dependent enzyme [Clostridia bacterium]|nr:YggS family pyridoxal phosphate-dependent enzyme [Clostridia bacterium]
MEQETQINVAENYRIVKERAAEAAIKSGRRPEDVRLVAVTKFVDTARIYEAIAAGCREVGENRAQELTDKYDFFKENGQTVHFIGQLQLNKVKYLIGRADLIQSADRPDAFSEIDRLAVKRGIRQGTLVEVNIGAEPQKAGIAPEDLPELLDRVSDMPGVRVKGLMCIPPAAGSRGADYWFARMKELYEDIKGKNIPNIEMEILSMGMSGDYPIAIAEGADMVRVGSAIFGARTRH